MRKTPANGYYSGFVRIYDKAPAQNKTPHKGICGACTALVVLMCVYVVGVASVRQCGAALPEGAKESPAEAGPVDYLLCLSTAASIAAGKIKIDIIVIILSSSQNANTM